MSELFCNAPNIIKCLDPRCWLSTPCKFAEKCMQRIVNNHILYYQCPCDFKENDLQVYMTPTCSMKEHECQPTTSPTTSPTVSPTNYPSHSPTYLPTTSPTPFVTQLSSGEDDFDYNLWYYYGGGGAILLIVALIIYFRQRIREYCCNNRVENDIEENSDESDEDRRNKNYNNCISEMNNN